MKHYRLLLLLALAIEQTACANFETIGKVAAYEKGFLAKEAMTFGGDAAEARFHEHIYVSKENASGGTGVGGGGCGCN